MSQPSQNHTTAAIQAIRDRLDPSDAPTVGPSPVNDYENDPVTRNDLLQGLNNWLVDDPEFIYGQLAEEASAEDSPKFRQAVDTELAKEDAAGAWQPDPWGIDTATPEADDTGNVQ